MYLEAGTISPRCWLGLGVGSVSLSFYRNWGNDAFRPLEGGVAGVNALLGKGSPRYGCGAP